VEETAATIIQYMKKHQEKMGAEKMGDGHA
jgi:hypothetical protein